MGRPLVSIITPVLNRVETMRTCLASVASQTYQPIEHIVVDGGSTDGTLDFIGAHRASYRFHWISEPDKGMYDAINKGISLAHGDVLAYLNSDDLYLPWSVDVAVRALQPGIELIYGDLGILLARANGKLGAFSIQFYPDFDLRYYSFVGTLGQPTVFWRRSLTEKIGPFDIRYRLIGDCEYWLRAALGGARLRHVPELMAVQVEHGSTLRATEATRLSEEFDTLRRAMMAVIDPPPSLRWERLKKSVAWRARQLEFFYSMKARHPHKWRHFVKELHAHGVDVRSRDLRLLAPARWRGDASLLGNAPGIYEILGGPEWL
jgi:glycosyltransferase involved in cell wall biosynthesis